MSDEAYKINKNRNRGHYAYIRTDALTDAVQEMEPWSAFMTRVRVLDRQVDAHEKVPSAQYCRSVTTARRPRVRALERG